MKHVIASNAKGENDILVAGKQRGAGVCHFFMLGGKNPNLYRWQVKGCSRPSWATLVLDCDIFMYFESN